MSKVGKSKHQLWHELCDLISQNPESITSLKVDPIIRGGIAQFTDSRGQLWNALADYHIRAGHFDMARDIFEEGSDTVTTVRDFVQVPTMRYNSINILCVVRISQSNICKVVCNMQ